MAPPNVRSTFVYVVVSLLFSAFLYNHYFSPSSSVISSSTIFSIHENLTHLNLTPQNPPSISHSVSTTAILLPDWEILLITSPNHSPPENYTCLFDTNEKSPATFSGYLPFPDRATFTCILPLKSRRHLPFTQPVLIKAHSNSTVLNVAPPPLLRWSYLVYDSLTTEEDVVLFVKGLNNRQGINRDPSEFTCVFFHFEENNNNNNNNIVSIKTAVTYSIQEVFRCKRPNLTVDVSLNNSAVKNVVMKVSLEILKENNYLVPSVAYYTPYQRKLETPPNNNGKKSLLCASTMVYNVGKYLREWVMYHSKIGVEKFLLYDNMSDDDLGSVVDELVKEGFDISIYFWRWPKTQEAGFSHSAVYAKDACTWMMYNDVDEFVYSPDWINVTEPSKMLLHPFIKRNFTSKVGQISIGCHEFGPSDQVVHPVMGVTQGYNCRRKYENRHKSIVLLDVVDDSLLNVIHHFHLKHGYKTRKLNINTMVVNHYKYQAWPEFKAKFRRRVSAYVLDWTQKMNPKSNDRTPGLGFSAVEPRGWPQRFCEMRDDSLKDLALKWFGNESESGIKMAWQR